MEPRKRAPNDEGRIAKKLDKLAEDINNLPQERQDIIKEVIHQRAYSSKDAAALLGISLSTIRRLMALGEIRFFHIGKRRIRIAADEIERFGNSLTLGASAKMLGVHNVTIRRLIKCGQLKATKIGRPYRIAISDLERVMEGNLENANNAEE